jgi:hypothetical protein
MASSSSRKSCGDKAPALFADLHCPMGGPHSLSEFQYKVKAVFNALDPQGIRILTGLNPDGTVAAPLVDPRTVNEGRVPIPTPESMGLTPLACCALNGGRDAVDGGPPAVAARDYTVRERIMSDVHLDANKMKHCDDIDIFVRHDDVQRVGFANLAPRVEDQSIVRGLKMRGADGGLIDMTPLLLPNKRIMAVGG